jgi:hypothetical protein
MRRLPFGRIAAGIWAMASLLHLPREQAPLVLAEFGRLLTPGGVLCLSVKEGSGAAWSDRAYGQLRPRYFTYWQPDEIDALLSDAHFDISTRWAKAAPNGTWLCRLARYAPR